MISFTPGEIRTYWAARAKLRRVGSELRGACPLHKGKRNSFAVNIETGQACCHSECGGQGWDIVGFEEQYSGCDFQDALLNIGAIIGRSLETGNGSDNGNGHSPPRQKVENTGGGKKRAEGIRAGLAADGYRPVREFHYTDNLRTVRFEHATKTQPGKDRPEKTFRWEHRAAGIWYSGGGGIEKPLYLNQLFRERDQAGTAIGFEGEAKADLAGDLGFAAFSFKDISEQVAGVLVDWDVVLWGDADPPGARNVTKAAEMIAKAGARSLKIAAPPPDLPGSGDIVDAVRGLGWTAAEVSQLIAGARPVSMAKPQGIRSISELPLIRECGAQPIEYVIEPILVVGAIVGVTGDSGSGKSTLLTALAGKAAAAGRPVLVLDRENPAAVVLDRLKRLGITDGPMLRYWGGWSPEEAPQPDSPIIIDWVNSCTVKPLIVIDSFVAFHDGDENDASAMRLWMGRCRKLANMGASMGIIHHDGKSETAKDFRGSSDFKAAVDAAFHVTNSSDDGRLGTLRVRCFKSRFGFFGTLIYHYADGQFILDQDTNAEARNVIEQLVTLLQTNPGIESKAFEELAHKRGLGRNRARLYLSDGVLAGTVRRESGRGNTKHNYLAMPKEI